MKILLRFLSLVALFFLCWFLLSRVDWMDLLHTRQVARTTEEKAGQMFWDYFKSNERELDSEVTGAALDSLTIRILRSNKLDSSRLKIHIIQKDEINAFALPDHHLVVFTGLIADCENEAELCGVLSHEIAHMEKRHVMKKLTKEIGLSALISLTGGSGGQLIGEALRRLTSTAYDRKLEQEADDTAVKYLLKAQIEVEPFANFLFRMADREAGLPAGIEWVSTHPASEQRARRIVEAQKDKKISSKKVLAESTWQRVQEAVK